MQKIVFLLCLIGLQTHAQKIKKADKAIIASLQTHVGYLADDKLEGRRTGTAGEKLAYEYISSAFSSIGLLPKGDNGTFLQPFEVNEGRQVNPATHLIINGNDLKLNEEYFPFIFSANASLEATPAVALQEQGNLWFWDIKDLLQQNSNNPHFDLADAIRTKAADVADKKGTGLLLYNTGSIKDDLQFDGKAKANPAAIPVLYISAAAKKKYLKDDRSILDVKLKVDLGEKKRKGHNVVGYIDNGAATTVIIGAHYDHLGYGEDHNSLYTGATPQIHNGADDNASGTAALIELGRLLKNSRYKKNNFLLIAFSGEELGLYGSKYFTEHPTIDLSTANYMINMDMVGRLNDSSRGITVGGYGTSPVWGELIASAGGLVVKTDSSGTGPSDHTSFYRKDIPVLFFFTGTHLDYHKPSDDADKINYTGQWLIVKYIYDCIGKTEKLAKLAFTKTREQSMARSSFKVTIGVMLDYTYSGGDGVKVDGVSENRPAAKAGIQPGDIIHQFGDYTFSDVTEYMKALGKFEKGQTTKAKVKRGAQELVVDITF